MGVQLHCVSCNRDRAHFYSFLLLIIRPPSHGACKLFSHSQRPDVLGDVARWPRIRGCGVVVGYVGMGHGMPAAERF